MRSRWAGSSGRSAKRRTTRLVAIAFQTGSRDGSLTTRGSARVRGVGEGCASRDRGGRVAPGRATCASVRRPPGSSSTASNWTSRSGMRIAWRLGRDLARGGRVERAAQGGRQERRDRASIAGILVQPRVRAARDDEGLDRRRHPARRRVTRGPPRRGARSGSSGPPCPHRRARAGPGPRSGRWPRSR